MSRMPKGEEPAYLHGVIPFPPMEAELVRELPEADGWQYEPKWDGFRGVLENAGPELALWSRNERPLLRYFPELRPLGDLLPPNSALDGEIVIARDGALDFDAMQMRLHPAESRIRKLSAEIPAQFVVFDVLVWDGEPVWKLPLEERRKRVEALSGFRLSPATRSLDEALGWLDRFEALGLDGVIAKKLGIAYLPGSRDGVVKVKEHKTADCVIVGVRWKKGDRSKIATLLLGLYRDDGGLDYVGSCAVGAKMQQEVEERIRPLLDESNDRRFSEPNRWGTGDLEETAVKPQVVAEVRYDKVQGPRFRHGTKFIRWRDDKDAADCTWRELRPPRDANAPTVDELFA
jgi:ATP-dependent DNA ligase